jgi:CRISPR-associated protein Cas1
MKKNYYILNNCRIKRKDNTIFIEKENEDRKYLPINDIEVIYSFGEVDFNSKAINFLARNNITIHLFNYYGYYTGSFYPREHLPSGFLLVKQVNKYNNLDERLAIAKEFINTAIYNILRNLKYYSNRKDGLKEIIERIEEEKSKIESVDTINSLMSIEGRAREKYYKAFSIITNDKMEFKKRVRNPPDNAMNAMISFCNSLVYSTCLSEIYNTQLNPTISYLHEPGVRRFSLSLDISEIFKPIIADRIIFKLINENMIKEEHFLKDLNFCYLNDKGKKIVLKEYDDKLKSTINHRTLEKPVSYKRLIRLECYKLIKHITNIEKYVGFKSWW